MTDIYTLNVVEVDDDTITLDVSIIYPDAGPPRGRGFAKNALWSLVNQLNQPEHPYLQSLADAPEVDPEWFIRLVVELSSSRDEAYADNLAEFTWDGSPYQGDTDWRLVIRVSLSDWLTGLEPGLSTSTSAYPTDGTEYVMWADHSVIARNLDEHPNILPNILYDDDPPPFIRQLWLDYYTGKPIVTRFDHQFDKLAFLIDRDDVGEVDRGEPPHIIPLFWFNAFAEQAYIYRPTPQYDWNNAPVLTTQGDGNWYPGFRRGYIFANWPTLIGQCIEWEIEAQQNEPVYLAMLQADLVRLKDWCKQHHYPEPKHSDQNALDALFHALTVDVTLNEQHEAVFRDYWPYFYEDYTYGELEREDFAQRMLSKEERQFIIKLLKHFEPQILTQLIDQDAGIDEDRLGFCLAILLHIPHETKHTEWIERVLHLYWTGELYYESMERILYCALLQRQARDAIPKIVEHLFSIHTNNTENTNLEWLENDVRQTTQYIQQIAHIHEQHNWPPIPYAENLVSALTNHYEKIRKNSALNQ